MAEELKDPIYDLIRMHVLLHGELKSFDTLVEWLQGHLGCTFVEAHKAIDRRVWPEDTFDPSESRSKAAIYPHPLTQEEERIYQEYVKRGEEKKR